MSVVTVVCCVQVVKYIAIKKHHGPEIVEHCTASTAPCLLTSLPLPVYFTAPTFVLTSLPPAPCLLSHANLSPATRNCPFSVLSFWDKNAGICAGGMPYRRDFPATTRI